MMVQRATRPGSRVQLLWGHTATHVTSHATGVTITATDAAGATLAFPGAFLAAADGAHSGIRCAYVARCCRSSQCDHIKSFFVV